VWIGYNEGMIRLTDEHASGIVFPEEHIADDRPGRKPIPTRRVLEAALWILNTGGAVAHASAELSELQDSASAFSDVVP
jgi:hypothetical protein